MIVLLVLVLVLDCPIFCNELQTLHMMALHYSTRTSTVLPGRRGTAAAAGLSDQ